MSTEPLDEAQRSLYAAVVAGARSVDERLLLLAQEADRRGLAELEVRPVRVVMLGGVLKECRG